VREIAPDLRVIDHPLRALGIDFGTRTTVVSLRGGGLWIHSPGPLQPVEASAIDALGRVRFVVAPNRMHHLFAGDAALRWPAARLCLAPGLARKRPDLPPGETLGDAAPPDWPDELDLLHVRGAPRLDEIVFLHRPSRSLLIADLCFNFGPPHGAWEALVQRANRMRGFGPSRLMRRALIRDRAEFRRSVARVSAWDFERIVLAHGELVLRDAARSWREAWAWL
jgi:hypothetical protein